MYIKCLGIELLKYISCYSQLFDLFEKIMRLISVKTEQINYTVWLFLTQCWWIVKIRLAAHTWIQQEQYNAALLLCNNLSFLSRILYVEQMRGAGCFYTRSRILNSLRTVSVGSLKVLNWREMWRKGLSPFSICNNRIRLEKSYQIGDREPRATPLIAPCRQHTLLNSNVAQ